MLLKIESGICAGAAINVIARSVSDEAIHSWALRGEMDCFVSLAMTVRQLNCLRLFEN
jgi:hypothetical protein